MKKDTLKRIIKYIGHYRIMFFASVLLAAVSVTLTLYLPKSARGRWSLTRL